MKHTLRSLSSLALVLTIAGCKVGPNYKRPVVDTPANYRGALAPDIAEASTAPSLGTQKWDTVFTDPVLQQLITVALKNNYDVKIAADRVLEQQAQVGVTKAAQYPTLSAGGTYDALGLPSSLFKSLNNSSNGSTTSNSTSQTNYYSGGLTASVAWNLDFWGMYRRQTEAARANLRATEWAKQTTYSTLVENVATDYYQLRTLDAELAITRSTLDARKQSLHLTQTLEQGGSDSMADVRQAEELYYTAQAQIPDLERQIEQQENNLRLLLGQDPGPIVRNIADSPSVLATASHPTDVPVGLPSDLLERCSARRRVAGPGECQYWRCSRTILPAIFNLRDRRNFQQPIERLGRFGQRILLRGGQPVAADLRWRQDSQQLSAREGYGSRTDRHVSTDDRGRAKGRVERTCRLQQDARVSGAAGEANGCGSRRCSPRADSV
jgi:multidrug efflux system outer membrane protein